MSDHNTGSSGLTEMEMLQKYPTLLSKIPFPLRHLDCTNACSRQNSLMPQKIIPRIGSFVEDDFSVHIYSTTRDGAAEGFRLGLGGSDKDMHACSSVATHRSFLATALGQAGVHPVGFRGS
jgi:hypothetical protein